MKNKFLHGEVVRILDSNYYRREIEHKMGKVAKKFVKANREFCEEEGISEDYVNLALGGSMSFAKWKNLAAIPFSSKTLFQAFREFLPENVRLILDELIWVDTLSNETIERKFDIKIYETKTTKYASGYTNTTHGLLPEYSFFSFYNHNPHGYAHKEASFTLFLKPEFRKLLSQYYDKPEGADFKAVTDLEDTQYIYEGEQDILLELPRIIAYKGQQQIKTTTKGRPQASTINKMRRKLNIKEFYPDAEEKELLNLRTHLLAGLVVATREATVSSDVVGQLKDLIKDTYVSKRFQSAPNILLYLKGTGYLQHGEMKQPEATILKVFKQLPVGEWVSLSNFEDVVKYNFYDIAPVTGYGAANRLFYVQKIEGAHHTYTEKTYIEGNLYYDSLHVPFIKGTCFLFAALGLLDMAHSEPNVDNIGETCKSYYDKLKYVRLTALGAYVLDLTSEYAAPAAISQSTITLSDDSLTIIIDESDTTAPIVLEPYTQRVSPNRFRTDFSFFLKGVANKKQLNDKITLFKQSVKTDIPPNWTSFFEELDRKIDPLKAVKNVKIFSIPTTNEELLQLIAKDPVFQQICFKAEGYLIIVTNKNMPKFKQRLQEFGYLLS